MIIGDESMKVLLYTEGEKLFAKSGFLNIRAPQNCVGFPKSFDPGFNPAIYSPHPLFGPLGAKKKALGKFPQ